jgi:hypothetical protein
MGRFSYWMNVSLDLRIEQAPGDDGGGLRQGATMHRYAVRTAKAVGPC